MKGALRLIPSIVFALFAASCAREHNEPASPVTVSASIDWVTSNSTRLKVGISVIGAVQLTERGICWSTNPNPSVSDSTHIVEASASNTFASKISELSQRTRYYIRAYATVNGRITYSDPLDIKTTPSPLEVITREAYSVTSATASLSGELVSDSLGIAVLKNVTSRAFCWALHPHPTIDDNILPNVLLGGGFELAADLNGLEESTTYYVRALATDSLTEYYGNEISFTTTGRIEFTLTTNGPLNVGSDSAIVGRTIHITANYELIKEVGICYAIHQIPTINDSKIVEGNVPNTYYEDVLRPLEINSTYYARAYVIDLTDKITYGNEISFATPP